MRDTQDIRKREQMQKMEALGQFAGGMAHDFNNILSIIEGHAATAVRQLKEGTLTPDHLQKIIAAARRGGGLTRQLLSFSRQSVDVDEKTDLASALRQQAVLLKPLLGESVRLSLEVLDEALWVEASPDQVMQIILNLALNARDAMPQGGVLSVVCAACPAQEAPAVVRERSPQASFVLLSVSDSGEGIAPDVLPRIFEPFFTTKDQGKGTGLGLSVVYGLVEQLRGSIEVVSRQGEGARFEIFLPLSLPQVLQEAPEEADEGRLAGKTILVAEDEPELRELLSDMFSEMHMKVLSAGNGNHALVVQKEYDGDIDFLLTDVVMPEMDGVKLGQMFSAARPKSSVIYMSGYPFMDGRKNIQVPKDELFISKPLQENLVRRVLERALERQKERLDKK